MIAAAAPSSQAADRDNCLLCHQFRGLSRLDLETNELRLFFCSAEYYANREGPHARVDCTGCHNVDEVRVIPHTVRTPVDCTQTCHIVQATGVGLRFGHERIGQSLEHSVHTEERLRELVFDPPLLRPGQSTCLYCHDQPVFGFEQGIPSGFRSHSGGTRCDTCHGEEFRLDIEYFAKHTAARMKPARTVKQLAQVCAVCHSDPAVLEQIGGHDVVASYLHSFHGKAGLLGSTYTATCVDCHSSHDGDQHMMLAKDDSESSIYPANVPDTCRTTACHPGAPPEMSAAAVHLEIDASQKTPEFFVAAFFILMTATVMAIFFLTVILDLLNSIIRRADPDHHRLVVLAKKVQEHPEGRRLIERMSVHQRVQHWLMAIPFIMLVVTGMPIKFADADWAQSLVKSVGELGLLRLAHRFAGVLLITVFIYHVGWLLTALWRQIRADKRRGVRIPIWKRIYNAPQMLTPQDALDFLHLFAHLLFLRKERPRFGRFNFFEKFEYWAVFWGMPVMGLSGLALWGNDEVAQLFTGRFLNFAFIIHSDEAYLAFIYIAAIHFFSVIFAPIVVPLSLGTLSGQAPARELVEGHRGYLEETAARLGITVHEEDHSGAVERLKDYGKEVARRVYGSVAMIAYGGVAFISLRFLVMMLVSHNAAPVEITDIPKRLDADTFFAKALNISAEHRAQTERPRGPLAHFHQIPKWFQPDPKNSCTTSGCHAPLPHGKRIEVRAFLNMHATFTDCTVCHAENAAAGDPRWFKIPERKLIDQPPMLKLATRLSELDGDLTENAEAIDAELIELMRAALPASGYHPQLQHWLLKLETTHPRSRIWRQLVDEMRFNIHMHVRGEYGAKIGMFNDADLVGAPTTAQVSATNAYLKLPESAPESQTKPLLDTIHQSIAPTGAMCTPCHQDNPTLLDISKLGYPQSRLRRLEENTIMRSVLSIEHGQPFHLPVESREETP